MGSHEYGQSDEKPDDDVRVVIRCKLAVRICLGAMRDDRKSLTWALAFGYPPEKQFFCHFLITRNGRMAAISPSP